MRQLNVTTPEGTGGEIAQIAFNAGISDVSINSVRLLKANKPEQTKDHVEIETATHLAKEFSATEVQGVPGNLIMGVRTGSEPGTARGRPAWPGGIDRLGPLLSLGVLNELVSSGLFTIYQSGLNIL